LLAQPKTAGKLLADALACLDFIAGQKKVLLTRLCRLADQNVAIAVERTELTGF
jgi:hypothetical protein